MTKSRHPRIAFVASPTPEVQETRARLAKRYGDTPPDDADVIVALGGDGAMLQTLHRFMTSGKPIYGMHRGTVGFLMNEFREEGLPERLAVADISSGWISVVSAAARRSASPSSRKSFIRKPTVPRCMP